MTHSFPLRSSRWQVHWHRTRAKAAREEKWPGPTRKSRTHVAEKRIKGTRMRGCLFARALHFRHPLFLILSALFLSILLLLQREGENNRRASLSPLHLSPRRTVRVRALGSEDRTTKYKQAEWRESRVRESPGVCSLVLSSLTILFYLALMRSPTCAERILTVDGFYTWHSLFSMAVLTPLWCRGVFHFYIHFYAKLKMYYLFFSFF